MVVQHGFKGGDQGRIVLQRFTHAHHHHIGDDALINTAFKAQGTLGKPELGNDFCGREVAAEPLGAGGAKRATHGTAGLGRNTQGTAVGFGDEHGFDGVALTHIEHPFDGAIG